MSSPKSKFPLLGLVTARRVALLGLAAAAMLGLALLALTVARLAGWWSEPLSPGALALLALWWMAAGGLLRYAGQVAARLWPPMAAWSLMLGTGLALWGSLLVSLPGTSAPALVLYWVWVLLGELAGWGFWLAVGPGRHQMAQPASLAPSDKAAPVSSAEVAAGHEDSPDAERTEETVPAATSPAQEQATDPMDNPHLMQHWQHWVQDGEHRWSGWVRVHRRPDEKEITVQVAFCPVLPQAPELLCEPVAGAEAEVEPLRIYAHGVHLRVRWPAAEAETEQPNWTVVALEAVARAPQSQSARAA